ncbi:hypothetical protein FZEAL_5022 [Fusarium zealandicum]|uniref:Uncharacterized protein n=1 Tax=Fusarium zealandicum TaxID=1053134 RepID=A0A8H4XK71_9HYPO|nr:hypothetical protein FZEAL_5022 [Fusarium zealandicum]
MCRGATAAMASGLTHDGLLWDPKQGPRVLFGLPLAGMLMTGALEKGKLTRGNQTRLVTGLCVVEAKAMLCHRHQLRIHVALCAPPLELAVVDLGELGWELFSRTRLVDLEISWVLSSQPLGSELTRG